MTYDPPTNHVLNTRPCTRPVRFNPELQTSARFGADLRPGPPAQVLVPGAAAAPGCAAAAAAVGGALGAGGQRGARASDAWCYQGRWTCVDIC